MYEAKTQVEANYGWLTQWDKIALHRLNLGNYVGACRDKERKCMIKCKIP